MANAGIFVKHVLAKISARSYFAPQPCRLSVTMAPIKKPPHARNRTFIKEWRVKAGLTQEALAGALKVNQSTISSLEVGKFPYRQDLLERMAQIFGCEPADILRGPPGQCRTKGFEIEIIADTARAMAQIYQVSLRDGLIDVLAGMIESARAQREALAPHHNQPQKDGSIPSRAPKSYK
jgi:transcriptional regulator with XRE-family HTH domain